MRGRARKRYYLEESFDAGLTYSIVAESDSLETLKELGDLKDLQPTRWVIKDRWTRAIMDMSSVHLSILGSLTGKEFSHSAFEPVTLPPEEIDTYEQVKQLRRKKLMEIKEKYEEGK